MILNQARFSLVSTGISRLLCHRLRLQVFCAHCRRFSVTSDSQILSQRFGRFSRKQWGRSNSRRDGWSCHRYSLHAISRIVYFFCFIICNAHTLRTAGLLTAFRPSSQRVTGAAYPLAGIFIGAATGLAIYNGRHAMSRRIDDIQVWPHRALFTAVLLISGTLL